MTFDEAVQVALKIMNETVLTSEAERLASIVLHIAHDFNDKSSEENEKSLEEMVLASRNQSLMYDALLIVSAQLLIEKSALPDSLAEFAAQALTNPEGRPSTRPGFRKALPGSLEERDLVIYDIVEHLCEAGLQLTRASTSVEVSACDAVAEAGRLSGKYPTSSSQIYKTHAKVKAREQSGRSQRLQVSIHRLAV